MRDKFYEIARIPATIILALVGLGDLLLAVFLAMDIQVPLNGYAAAEARSLFMSGAMICIAGLGIAILYDLRGAYILVALGGLAMVFAVLSVELWSCLIGWIGPIGTVSIYIGITVAGGLSAIANAWMYWQRKSKMD